MCRCGICATTTAAGRVGCARWPRAVLVAPKQTLRRATATALRVAVLVVLPAPPCAWQQRPRRANGTTEDRDQGLRRREDRGSTLVVLRGSCCSAAHLPHHPRSRPVAGSRQLQAAATCKLLQRRRMWRRKISLLPRGIVAAHCPRATRCLECAVHAQPERDVGAVAVAVAVASWGAADPQQRRAVCARSAQTPNA
jgi:hypothetical protein